MDLGTGLRRLLGHSREQGKMEEWAWQVGSRLLSLHGGHPWSRAWVAIRQHLPACGTVMLGRRLKRWTESVK